MLFITLFALTFKPWEACLSKVVLEMIDILNGIVKDEEEMAKLDKFIKKRVQEFATEDRKGKIGKGFQSEEAPISKEIQDLTTNHIDV